MLAMAAVCDNHPPRSLCAWPPGPGRVGDDPGDLLTDKGDLVRSTGQWKGGREGWGGVGGWVGWGLVGSFVQDVRFCFSTM